MLRFVDTATQEIAPYSEYTPHARLERIGALADALRGTRILHLNATPFGGGVAELLNSIVPLERGLGLDVSWGVIVAEPAFFELTKRLHNGLQGDLDFHVEPGEAEAYLRHNRMVAEAIGNRFDIVVVHDPQPAPARCLSPETQARWIWRIHLDLSAYDRSALAFLEPYIRDYDALVFTMPEFVPEPLREHRIHCFPPAIDPLSPKNLVLPGEIADRIVRWLGVHLDRPLMTQVSRFDPWKDPLGVLRVYREVRENHPGLQLAMLGSMAQDDPQGWDIYSRIRAEAGDDPDIHIGSNFTGIGNMEVNAFQRRSDVIIQKSIREGFGLVVSETVWKGTPIVAGDTGGIPLQIQDGEGGYLVSREDDWARRIDELLAHPEEATRIAERGRERVRESFLITRLLEDELQLMASLT
jgi:trehalose synthase